MAISFVGAGTGAGGVGDVVPTIHASSAAGDLLILVFESEGEDASDEALPADWNLIDSVASATGGAIDDTRVTAAWRWWYSGISAPTVPDTGDHTAARVYTFRGVDVTTPIEAFTIGSDATGATSHTAATGLTTLSANAWVALCLAQGDDVTFTAVANASLTGVADAGGFLSTAGADGTCGLFYGTKAVAGGAGSFTWTSSTSEQKAWIALSLKPAVNAVPPAPNTPTGTAGLGQVTLAWPSVLAYPQVTDYKVEYKLASEPTVWTEFPYTDTPVYGTANQVIVTGLTGGASHNFRISAQNSEGFSSVSGTRTTTPKDWLVTSETDGQSAGATATLTSPAFTPLADDVLIIIASARRPSAATTNSWSISGTGGVTSGFTLIEESADANPGAAGGGNTAIWFVKPSSATSSTVTVDAGGDASYEYNMNVIAVQHYLGAVDIVQSVFGVSTYAAPVSDSLGATATFGSATALANHVVGAVHTFTDVAGVPPAPTGVDGLGSSLGSTVGGYITFQEDVSVTSLTVSDLGEDVHWGVIAAVELGNPTPLVTVVDSYAARWIGANDWPQDHAPAATLLSLEDGDVIYAFLSADDDTGGAGLTLVIADQAGTSGGTWTLIHSQRQTTTGRFMQTATWRKVVTNATNEMGVTYRCSGGNAEEGAVDIVVVRGADTTTPEDVAETGAGTLSDGASVTNQPITTVTDQALVLLHANLNGNTTTDITAPPFYTLVTEPSSYGANSIHVNSAVAYKSLGVAGAETPGAWTFVAGNNSDDSCTTTVAVRPAAPSDYNVTGSISGGGVLAATVSGAHNTTGSVSGGGVLAAVVAGAHATTGSVSGTSHLTATVAGQRPTSGSVSAGGTLTASVTPSAAVTGSISAGSTLTSTVAGSHNTAGSISAGSTLTATVAASHNTTGAVSAPSHLTAAVTGAHNVTGSISAGTTLAATVTPSVAVSGSISGTSNLNAVTTSNRNAAVSVSGSGTLTASVSGARAVTGTVSAGSTLTGSTTGAHSVTGSISGTSNLTATVSPSDDRSGSVSAGGTLAATVAGAHNTSGSISAGGTLTATFAGSHNTTGSISGGGTLTATVAGARSTTGALSGGGALTASATGVHNVTGSVSAGGTLSGAAGQGAVNVTGSLSGGGALTAVVAGARSTSGSISAGTTLTGSAAGAHSVAGTCSAGSTLTATVAGAHAVTGSVSAGGTLTAATSGAHTTTGSISGGGVLAASVAGAHSIAVVLSGGSTLTATNSSTRGVAVSLSGGGTLTGDAQNSELVGSISGGGVLAATNSSTRNVTGSVSAGGAPTATVAHVASVTGSISGTSNLTTTVSPSDPRSGSVSGGGTLAATVAGVHNTTGTLSAGSTLTATIAGQHNVTATISGGGALTASVSQSGSGSVVGSISGGGSPAASTSSEHDTDGLVSTGGARAASVAGERQGSGTLSGEGALSAAGDPRHTASSTLSGSAADLSTSVDTVRLAICSMSASGTSEIVWLGDHFTVGELSAGGDLGATAIAIAGWLVQVFSAGILHMCYVEVYDGIGLRPVEIYVEPVTP